ncbi:MAG TPA: hypothetical protein VM243_04460 [Phycisphaerae bacterium]|nr:hypothetical protein [Phycisphaerae bacterium]
MRNRELHFSIGAVNVSLRSDCRSFADEYLSLYAPYRCDAPRHNSIAVQISARHRFPWRRGPWTVQAEAAEGFEVHRRYEVLPHLEWAISWQLIRQREEYVQLHSAAMEVDGRGLLLPGDPGSGKSTLAAGLLARGWSYLCDEFALIDPTTRNVQSFPRALCVKEPSFPVVDALGLPLHRKTPYQKPTKGRVAFLNPLDARPDAAGRPSPVRWVVFPRYVEGATPTLKTIPRSQAAFDLARQCFNFQVHQAGAVAVLADLIRGADCYQLTCGDIHSTCDLMESLLLQSAARKAG